MSAQTTPATRTNHRDAGAPDAGLWFGRGKTASGAGIPVTFERHGRGLTVRDAAGEVVDSFGDTGKFWYAPTPVAEVSDSERKQAEVDAAHVEAAHMVTMARLCDYRTPMEALANRSLHGMVLAHQCTDSSLAYAAALAFKAGRRALGEAIEARRAAVQADIAAAEYAYAVDCATRTTVALPPAPVVEVEVERPAAEQVVIVPCGGKKDDTATRAGDLYVGSYHQATRRAAAAIAERTGARVLILSALYGLITLDQRVAPYNLRMGQKGSITADHVRRQAAALGVRTAHVTVLAGKAYADVITAVWPDAVRPLDGTRGIGPQLSRLKAIAEGGLADQQAPAERPHGTRPALLAPLIGEQLALFPAPPLDLLAGDLGPRVRARRAGRRVRRTGLVAGIVCRRVALVGL